MIQYSPVWAHGELKEIFPNIFLVTGTNITTHEGTELQHSCNMIVVKHANALTLINTVRLNEKGLAALDSLGQVTNVIRLGAFHGRHDAFYLDKYSAQLWALKGMKHENERLTDIEFMPDSKVPFPDCSLFNFETSVYPEGILHLNHEGGILITCDSIKNWTRIDEFFSENTGKLYEQLGFLGTATISKIWQQATQVQAQDFTRLQSLSYRHLLSAHGEPLIDDAYERVGVTIKQEFTA